MCTRLIQEIDALDNTFKDSITKKYNSFKDSYNKINQINHDFLTPQDNMCKRVGLYTLFFRVYWNFWFCGIMEIYMVRF